MADWQAFAESFLNRSAEGIRARSLAAEEYEERQRELARTTGTRSFKLKRSAAQQMGALGSQAKSLGATDAMIAAAIDSGPTGLVDLSKNLNDLKTSLGDRWTPEAALNSVDIPEAYETMKYEPDWMQKRIKSTVGLGDPTVGDYKAPESSFLKSIFGFDAREQARVRLDSELGVGGYSLLDLNELASQSDYESLMEGAYVNFSPVKVFDPENTSSESLNFTKMLDLRLDAKSDYKGLQRQYEDIEEDYKYASLENGEEQRKKDLAAVSLQMGEIKSETARILALEGASIYTGGGYIEAMSPLLQSYGVDIASLTQKPEDEELPPITKAAVAVEEKGGATDFVDNNSVTYSHPTFKQYSEDGKIKFIHDSSGKVQSAVVTVAGQQVVVNDPAEVEELFDYTLDPDKTTAGPELDLTNVGADLSETPAGEMPTLNPALMTEEEFDALSRQQKEAAGLPVSALGDWMTSHLSEEDRDARVAMIDLKRNVDPEAFYKITMSGLNLNRPMKVKGSNLKYIPDAAIARGYNNVSISSFDIDEDIPRKTVTKRKLIKTYETAGAEGEVQIEGEANTGMMSPIKPKRRPDGTETAPTEEEASQQVLEASKPLEEFVKGYGQDVVTYLVENGFAADDDTDEIREGLAMWFDENAGKLGEMPDFDDMGGLVFLMKQALSGVKPDLSDNPEV